MTVFQEDTLTCYSRKSKMNDGWILFGCFSFRVLVLCMAGSLSRLTGTLKYNQAMVLSNTCAFPTVTGQNGIMRLPIMWNTTCIKVSKPLCGWCAGPLRLPVCTENAPSCYCNCVLESGINGIITAYLKQMALIGRGVSNLLILTRAGTLNAKHQYCTESCLINWGSQTHGYY